MRGRGDGREGLDEQSMKTTQLSSVGTKGFRKFVILDCR